MTLNVLKWVYDLGVRQERMRIASHLELQVAARAFRGNPHNYFPLKVVTPEEKERENRRKIEFETAVSREVGDIIQSILDPSHQLTGPSIMFPDHK